MLLLKIQQTHLILFVLTKIITHGDNNDIYVFILILYTNLQTNQLAQFKLIYLMKKNLISKEYLVFLLVLLSLLSLVA